MPRAVVRALFRRGLSLAVVLGAVWPGSAVAEEDRVQAEYFELHIRPLLVQHCVRCHDGSDDAQSVLTFNGRGSLLTGGDFGPAVVPGKPKASLLWQAVNGTHKELRMPPKDEAPLSREQIAALGKWIEHGAIWPSSDESLGSSTAPRPTLEQEITTDHWSFQLRSHPVPPEVSNEDWGRSPIDRFVFAKLEAQGLAPSELADKRTLIRRATFDLTGLPPTPAEINAFIADTSDDAYVRLIDRLLQSRHYGERWGRHWLDVARYADTQGDVGDFPIHKAYLYRNWVIDAFNADLPYDRFIQAQLAGDLLARDSADPAAARGLVIATGFVALSRRFGNTKYEDQHLTIEDTIDTLGRGILGVTLRCARCHDHKFDPLLQSDYYGLYGIFQSTRYPTMGASNEKSPSALSPPIPDAAKQQEIDEYFGAIERYSYQINNHFRPWLQPTIEEYQRLAKELARPDLPGEKRTQLEDRQAELLGAFDGAFRELLLHGLDWVRREKDRMADNPPCEMVYALSEADPKDTRLQRRGNPETLGPLVSRHFPRALAQGPPPQLQGSGRLELANWITAPDHPLTARVIVNRVWQHHFGRGIVATASNFGVQGSLPSHPELLDYLANQFVEQDGWSLKRLHRRIMLSRTYRLSSTATAESRNRDPENIFLSHYARRRLEAEAIRDAILAVSGKLDESPGGEFPFPHWKNPQFSLNRPFKAEYSSHRRSVYMMTQRLFRQPFFALFDGPDRNQSTEERSASMLPTQVLYLLNSPFVQEQAAAFANRVTAATNDDAAALAKAYELAYGRLPTTDESSDLANRLMQLREQCRNAGVENPDEVSLRAWSSLAKAMFASNEFLFVE